MENDTRPEAGERVIVHTWRGDIHGTLVHTSDIPGEGSIMASPGVTVLADDGDYLRPNWERVRKEPPVEIKPVKRSRRKGASS